MNILSNAEGAFRRHKFITDHRMHIDPTDGVSALSWWWGLRAPETLSYTGGSVATGRATHAGQVNR
jgi:hypothetical protein